MIKFGQITQRNDTKGLVTVKFARPEACGKCNACGIGSQKGEVTLPSKHAVGSWVRVELPEARFLQATTLVYILPLAGLLLGLLGGWWLSAASDIWTILGAAIGLLAALVILFAIDKRVSKKPEWTPVITAVYSDNPTTGDIDCGV